MTNARAFSVTSTKSPASVPTTPPKRASKKPPVNVVSHSEKSKGYRYEDKDPDMYAMLYLMDQSGHEDAWFVQKTGLTHSTLYNWRMGRTKRPAPSSRRIILRVLNVTRRYFIGDQEVVIPAFQDMERAVADILIAAKMQGNTKVR